MVLQVLADAGQCVKDRDADAPATLSGRPTPESSSSCGVPIAPAVSTVSRAARAVSQLPAERIFEAGDAAVLDDAAFAPARP